MHFKIISEWAATVPEPRAPHASYAQTIWKQKQKKKNEVIQIVFHSISYILCYQKFWYNPDFSGL